MYSGDDRIEEDVRRAIIERYGWKRNINHLAREFGVSRSSVQRILRAAGIDTSSENKKRAVRPGDEEEILRLYAAGRSGESIAELMERNVVHVYRLLREKGVLRDTARARLGAERRDLYRAIVESRYAEGQSQTVIARELGVSLPFVNKLLGDKGRGRRRRYTLREDAFSSVRNEETAYWLGFIAADGTCTGVDLYLRLAAKDVVVLERFRNFLGSNAPITEYRSGGLGETPAVRLGIHSGRIGSDLLRLGITHSKSYTLTFPTNEQVPPDVLRHFIRGYFDGDGSLSVWTAGNGQECSLFSVCGTEGFLTDLQSHLERCLGLRHTRLSRNLRSVNMHELRYGSWNDLKKIKSYLYDGATVWLERKRERFDMSILATKPGPKYTVASMAKLAQAADAGGVCLSRTYEGAHRKLTWRCGDGHAFDMTPNNVRRGQWCPTCRRRQRKCGGICKRPLGEVSAYPEAPDRN